MKDKRLLFIKEKLEKLLELEESVESYEKYGYRNGINAALRLLERAELEVQFVDGVDKR